MNKSKLITQPKPKYDLVFSSEKGLDIAEGWNYLWRFAGNRWEHFQQQTETNKCFNLISNKMGMTQFYLEQKDSYRHHQAFCPTDHFDQNEDRN